MAELLAERGSLSLSHDPGDDRNPETFTVFLTESPRIAGSLEVAREWFELHDPWRHDGRYRLNGSQALTVKTWYEEYL